MKKNIKALGMLALAATLSMGMTSVANATAGDYNIIINGQNGAYASIDGNTYTVYKIADFDVSGGVYTNIKAAPGFESLQSTLEALDGKTTDSTEAKAFADVAAGLVTNSMTPAGSVVVSESSKTVTVHETGYYLIVDTAHKAENPYLTTRYILKAVDGVAGDLTTPNNNEDIHVKTSQASVTKKIISEHDGTLEDANTVAIGDTIKYQLDADIPMYKADAKGINYQLTDTMSDGLTFAGIESVKISSDGGDWGDAAYTTTADSSAVGTAGATVKIKLTDDAQLRTNTKVRVILSATLNTGAKVGAEGNPNSVDLSYSNKYTGGGDNYTTPEDTVITYTGELNLVKKDRDENQKPLAGAEFTIYREAKAGETSTITAKINGNDVDLVEVKKTVASDADGKITVTGLDVGTYYAIETKAPEGYSIDATPVELVLTVNNNTMNLDGNGDAGRGDKLDVDSTIKNGNTANSTAITNYPATWEVNNKTEETIYNAKGLTLPGTGGMGTTLFTFGGIALILVACVMFIVYTRKQKKQS